MGDHFLLESIDFSSAFSLYPYSMLDTSLQLAAGINDCFDFTPFIDCEDII